MRWLPTVVLVVLAGAAQAQTPDPIATAVGQEWQASEVERGHLAEALQKLIQAYTAAQEQRKAIDAYWKDYVAGLTRDTQTGSN